MEYTITWNVKCWFFPTSSSKTRREAKPMEGARTRSNMRLGTFSEKTSTIRTTPDKISVQVPVHDIGRLHSQYVQYRTYLGQVREVPCRSCCTTVDRGPMAFLSHTSTVYVVSKYLLVKVVVVASSRERLSPREAL
jgi:hypothetical protein